MIFVPLKKDCQIWEKSDEAIHIFYFWKKEDKYPIIFKWLKTPKHNKLDNSIYYEYDGDPFYLEVNMYCGELVLPCALSSCGCYPHLRYNKIINKWFCCCPSSALCTKNDDEYELNTMFFNRKGKYFTEKNGFCDDPIKAIARWNISNSNSIINISNKILKGDNEYSI